MFIKCSNLFDPKGESIVSHSQLTTDSQMMDLIATIARYGTRAMYCRSFLGKVAIPGSQKVFLMGPSTATAATKLALHVPYDNLYFVNSDAGPLLARLTAKGSNSEVIEVMDGDDIPNDSIFEVFPLRRLKGLADVVYYCTGSVSGFKFNGDKLVNDN